jgi:hypothetical protein
MRRTDRLMSGKGKCMKWILLLMGLMVGLTGCIRVKPIRVEPIEITMNVNLRVVQELTNFFDDLDAQSTVMYPPSTPENPQPTND